MDLEKYISSGVLENYVLGLLSEKENREVMAMMERHYEVASHVRSLEESLETYGRLYTVEPPSELKSLIMNQIRDLKVKDEAKEDKPALTTSPAQLVSPKVLRDQISIWRKLAIAGTIILMVSIGFNIYLSSQKHRASQLATRLALQNKQLSKNTTLLNDSLSQIQKQVTLLANPDIRPVVMKGVKQHPAFNVTVYWNTNDQTVYLGKSDLPTLPTGKVYQLWAIVDGKPVDLGLYTPKKANLPVQMKKVSAGQVQAFAITLEKAGGNPTPTMDQMYVMGGVS
ncbi:anti-sigma factor [Arachidicoccus ginsenosidivorans]